MCCYLMQVLQVTSSFACELTASFKRLSESSSLFVRRIYGKMLKLILEKVLCFSCALRPSW